MTDRLLKNIHSPSDLKNLPFVLLDPLCGEIRERLVATVSTNGGHLASNLGVVELTVALHRSFDFPTDQIVWDVGHQCYTHKLLTGRQELFDTLRQENGLAGFPKRSESEYDAFNAGHSSTSISAALGLARAKELLGQKGRVIAVMGDGALSGGLAYEGLNNAGRYHKNFIVVLNDNKMSISRNVGAMARYLAVIRTKQGYIKAKSGVESFLNHIPVVGNPVKNVLAKSKTVIKNALYPSTIFEEMGFKYLGPVDGHDFSQLMRVFEVAKREEGPVLVHVCTIKGKGYPYAEKNPRGYHGVSGFDIETGEKILSSDSFSDVFGETLCSLAEKDDRICAITAAMKSGTGLNEFSKQFKDRFFDVGIAEDHAVTYAAGMAANGMLPVFAVYSTFLQRSYDQIVHDAATQNLKVVLAIDRAGVVGSDGETHQGVFDVSFLMSVPNVTIYAPTYFDELRDHLKMALYDCEGVAAVRYPRGGEPEKPDGFCASHKSFDLLVQKINDGKKDILLVTFGRIFSSMWNASCRLSAMGIQVDVMKINRIKPLDLDMIRQAAEYQKIYFFEEGMEAGGVGEHFCRLLYESKYHGDFSLTGIGDSFVQQASVERELEWNGLDENSMVKIVYNDVVQNAEQRG